MVACLNEIANMVDFSELKNLPASYLVGAAFAVAGFLHVAVKVTSLVSTLLGLFVLPGKKVRASIDES